MKKILALTLTLLFVNNAQAAMPQPTEWSTPLDSLKFINRNDLSPYEIIRNIGKNPNKLQGINISSYTREIGIITNHIARILQNNPTHPSPTHVNLSGCTRLTDDAIKALTRSCHSLIYINLSNCDNLTDDAIRALAQNCPHLTHVNVSNCHNLTNDAIIELAQNCPGLTYLNVSGCHNLTGDDIITLAQNCPGLSHLNVSGCVLLKNTAIRELIQNCPDLAYLNVQGCRNLTDAAFTDLPDRITLIR